MLYKILLSTLIFSSLVFGLNSQTTGYMTLDGGGKTKLKDLSYDSGPYGDGYLVKNHNKNPVFISTKTSAQWNSIKTYTPNKVEILPMRNGGWSLWNPISSCSNSCGNGNQTFQKLCNNPSVLNEGEPCLPDPGNDGKEEEIRTCTAGSSTCGWTTPYTSWTDYGSCSASCGNGTQQQRSYKTCTSNNPGANCQGSTPYRTKNVSCYAGACPVGCTTVDGVSMLHNGTGKGYNSSYQKCQEMPIKCNDGTIFANTTTLSPGPDNTKWYANKGNCPVTPPSGGCGTPIVLGSVTWAACNVGASSPSGYGSYLTHPTALAACPSGWRMPSVADVTNSGGVSNVTSKIKLPLSGSYTNHWYGKGKWGTIWLKDFHSTNGRGTPMYWTIAGPRFSFHATTTYGNGKVPVRCVKDSCSISSWSPSTSTKCSNAGNFTQTSNCGTTRSVSGTKNCSVSYYNAWCKVDGTITTNGGNTVVQSFNGCGNGGTTYSDGASIITGGTKKYCQSKTYNYTSCPDRTQTISKTCSMSHNNAGCSTTISCPAGTKISNARAACDLEYGPTNYGVWGSFRVTHVSDNASEGHCMVNGGDISINSAPLNANGQSSMSIACKEHDNNGGDCEVKAQIKCQ